MIQLSIFLSFSLVFLSLGTNAKLDTQECRNFGFDETLFCDKCDILKEFVDDDVIHSRCLDCCKEQNDIKIQEKYSKITLMVSKKHANQFKHISQLVNNQKKMDKYKNFAVVYQKQPHSTLYLYDKTSKLVSQLNIEHWKDDMLEEFLDSKLE